MSIVGKLTALITADTKGLTVGLTRAQAQITGFSNSLQGHMAANSAAIAGMGKALLGVSVVMGVVSAGIMFHTAKVAGQFEKWEIAFETMLGSAKAAKKMMKDLFDFAKRTPFQVPELVANTKRLMGMGIEAEKVIGTMRILGDVAAGVGVPIERIALNFGQVKAQLKLTGRELRDFAVAGVPLLAILAKNLNKTTGEIQDMISAGEIGFADVEQAFITMTSEGGRFYNLMARLNKSYLGQISNLQDQITRLKVEIGKVAIKELSGDVSNLIASIEKFNKKLKENTSYINAFIKGTIGFFKVIGKIISTVFTGLVSATVMVTGIIKVLMGSAKMLAIGYWEASQIIYDSLVGAFQAVWDNGSIFLDRMAEAIHLFMMLDFSELQDALSQPFELSGEAAKRTFSAIGKRVDNLKTKFADNFEDINNTIKITIDVLDELGKSILGISSEKITIGKEEEEPAVGCLSQVNEQAEALTKNIKKAGEAIATLTSRAIPASKKFKEMNKVFINLGSVIKESIADVLIGAFDGAKISAEKFFDYLWKQLAKRAIITILNSIFPGTGTLGLGLFGGEQGGLFRGGIPVPAFQGGVSGYQMPSDIKMDTQPVLVGGGEELDVRSIGQVGDRDKLLSQLIKEMQSNTAAVRRIKLIVGDRQIFESGERGKYQEGGF